MRMKRRLRSTQDIIKHFVAAVPYLTKWTVKWHFILYRRLYQKSGSYHPKYRLSETIEGQTLACIDHRL